MEEPVEKRRRIGSIRGFRVCSQRASFERGHASTVLLITPSAGLLTAHLDGIVEWEVFAYLGCFEASECFTCCPQWPTEKPGLDKT